MFTSEKESFEVQSENKKINVVKTIYKADQDISANLSANNSLETFSVDEKFKEISKGAKDFSAKNAWFNPGGWQSWAPGFEVAPNEKRPDLKNIAISQWNQYLTVPNTKNSLYKKKNIILGQFIVYFRVNSTYFVIASTGNTKELLPPVQYIYNKRNGTIEIQIYDSGKAWAKGEKACEICMFTANSFFEAKDAIHELFANPEFAGKKCASRFDDLAFLGEVPGGWESWYNHYADINQNLILDDLDSLCNTKNIISMMYLDQKKPVVFQIDDGWEYTVGHWDIRTDRFPNGLKSISDKVEAKGMIPGLWIAPFLMDLRSPVAKEHPDWVLCDSEGIPVTAGYNPLWGAKKGEFQPRKSGTFYCLDLSNDQVVDYLDKLIERAINEWGIRYLKLDFLYAGMIHGAYKNAGSAYQWYDRAVKVLTKRKKNNEGKEVAYLGCGMPFEHSFNDFPLSRIGCDTYEHWDNNLIKMLKWNGRTSAYLSMKDTIGRALWNKGVYYNDPDVVFVRNNNCSLTRDEKILIASVDILLGNQVMYSDDPATSSSEEEVALAKEIADIARKFENEEFSVTPVAIDIFKIESRSGKYSGTINLVKRNIEWKEAK